MGPGGLVTDCWAGRQGRGARTGKGGECGRLAAQAAGLTSHHLISSHLSPFLACCPAGSPPAGVGIPILP